MRYILFISLLLVLHLKPAHARIPDVEQGTRFPYPSDSELETQLAPIALYPDSLLSHILIASTYPLEVVQAARWRDIHKHLDADTARERVEQKNWSPSVKALVPFHSLLQSLDRDLEWLQSIGIAFTRDEQRVLFLVQNLREKAYESGNLRNTQYLQVEYQPSHISIQPVVKEVVYVPYYDTRVVYGHWSAHHHPVNWYSHHNHYYSDHHGFRWSIGFSIRPHFYFSDVHWHKRHVRVSHYYYKPYQYKKRYPRASSHEYSRWQHNNVHRKSKHYKHKVRPDYGYDKPHRARLKSKETKRFVNPGYKPQPVKKTVKQHQLQPKQPLRKVPKQIKRYDNKGYKVVKQHKYDTNKRHQQRVNKPVTQYKRHKQTNAKVVRHHSHSKQSHR